MDFIKRIGKELMEVSLLMFIVTSVFFTVFHIIASAFGDQTPTIWLSVIMASYALTVIPQGLRSVQGLFSPIRITR
jgi:hypothetical protein